MHHRPRTISLLPTLSEMRFTLTSVSELVDSFMGLSMRRRAMVQLDHLIICLTQSVVTFSELEKFVSNSLGRVGMSRWDNWLFASRGEKLGRFNTRIQQQKTCISLVLNILQCESDIDARESGDTLQGMIEKLLDENKFLQDKIERLGGIVRDTVESVKYSTRIENSSNIFTITEGEENETSTIKRTPSVYTTKVSSSPTNDGTMELAQDIQSCAKTTMRPFEVDLVKSFVYLRALGDECDISFTTGQPNSALWSLLSGLSLSRVSNISVIGLPVSAQDIWNSSWYKTNLPPRQLKVDTYKIAVLGYINVGKSALTRRFCFDFFNDGLESSVKDSVSLHTVLDGTPIRIDIVDTPGVGLDDSRADYTIKAAEGMIVAYSTIDFGSFFSVRPIVNRATSAKSDQWNSGIAAAIVGTKTDLAAARSVPRASGASAAKELSLPYFECSAKTGENVQEAFLEVARDIRDRRSRRIQELEKLYYSTQGVTGLPLGKKPIRDLDLGTAKERVVTDSQHT
ncbi:P-loop containing nucleoside triphosphate hydrolase protein [Hypoxylon trugodes]|uniref:P-loop containing nucleoside triphosphate hydrolase protein n=1 Tax=Hypoxylon trugodes TaxID=326681 RepID=UPI0021965840|nr:P-loop containing nucleoside triphosphate hydrolase protein [Hypoxylon trugodes]KAI1387826.1 P-loop containing nucleoside triphosphate hydrolase protein [Hypoxylon trugodes]